MLTFFPLLFTFSLLLSYSPFLYVIISSFSLLIFLSTFNMSFNSSLSMLSFIYDEVSLFIVLMTFIVIYISYLFSYNLKSSLSVNITLLSMLFFCLVVFITSNLFVLYLSYEASLIPIIYIILKWGSYPERSVSSMMLLLYTAIFTFPFLYVLFFTHSSLNTLDFSVLLFSSSLSIKSSSLVSLVVLFTFAVKLPIYGLHFWLPIAHVEAPTFGSMILAGVLLKLGGVGLIRSSYIISSSLLSSWVLAYLALFLVIVTIICCFQSDFNRLVAYSSVSHMMAIPVLILSNLSISFNSIILVMFFHGLSSPLIFMFVGVLYSLYSTRQLMSVRGLVLISPLFSFLLVLAFFFTMSAPPFPSFLGEVIFFLSSVFLSPIIILSFILFSFFSLVYNLNWLSSILFSSPSQLNMSSYISYSQFLPIFTSIIIAVPSLILISFV